MGTCNWIRLQILGRGSTATVSLAADRLTGRLFAVKSVELARSEMLQREERILSLLSCPRVVSCVGHDITVEKNGLLYYNLFLEYVPQTLSEAICRNGGRLEEGAIRSHTRAILCGLAHIHSKGLARCDIKGQNILIGPDGAKIADLGCARRSGKRALHVAGTPVYMAPEVARGQEQGLAGDVWAVGCTVIEMATGRPPWTDQIDPVSALYRIGLSVDGPGLPGEISDLGRDFLSNCFRRCPAERWTVDQLLKHPFVDESVCGQKLMDFGSVFNISPKSTLELGFWGSVEETQTDPDRTQMAASSGNGSPAERIRILIGSSPISSFSDWKTDSAESWICVRNENILDGPGSWTLIREEIQLSSGICLDESSDRIVQDLCTGACKFNESNGACNVCFSTSDSVSLFSILTLQFSHSTNPLELLV